MLLITTNCIKRMSAFMQISKLFEKVGKWSEKCPFLWNNAIKLSKPTAISPTIKAATKQFQNKSKHSKADSSQKLPQKEY